MFDWKLRLSKKVDIWIVVLCWAIAFFDGIACFIVYSVASPYDLYLPDQSALEKGIRGFLYVGTIALIATVVMLGDRIIARKHVRDQQFASEFTPPLFHFKKRNIVRVIGIAVILFFALPWVFALVGIYISDIPGLGLIFLSRDVYHGLPAVHLGSHHGTWAYQFGILAIIFTVALDSPYYIKNKLSRTLIVGTIIFLAGYAIVNGLEDGLNEQILKRGIDLLLYNVIKAIYSNTLGFYSVLAVIIIVVMIFWYRAASKKEKALT